MLTFLTSHCSLFASSSLPSLCTVSSISETAGSTNGTYFWTCVWDSQQLFIIFRNILEMMPSQLQFCYWKQESAQQPTRWVRMGNHSDVLRNLHWKSSVKEQRHKLHRDQQHMTGPPLEFRDIFHIGVLTCQWIIKHYVTGLSWQFCKLLHIFICQHEEQWHECSPSSIKLLPHFNKKNPSKVCVLYITIELKDICSISYISDAISLILKQNIMHMHHSFKSAIRKSWIRLNMQSQTPLERKCTGLLMWKLPDWLRW